MLPGRFKDFFPFSRAKLVLTGLRPDDGGLYECATDLAPPARVRVVVILDNKQDSKDEEDAAGRGKQFFKIE